MTHRQIVCWLVLSVVMLAACSPAGGGGAQPVQPAAPSGGGNVIVVTNTPTPSPQVPANIPIMPGATDLNVSEADISYVIKSDLNGVISFYQQEMAAKGWREQEKPSIIGDFGRMFYATPEQQASFILNASPSLNQVVIRISLIYLKVVEATPKP